MLSSRLSGDEMLDRRRADLISWGRKLHELCEFYEVSARIKKDETLSRMARGLISWGENIIHHFR